MAGFRVFDPAIDPVTVGVGAVGGVGTAAAILKALSLLVPNAYGDTLRTKPPGADTGATPDK